MTLACQSKIERSQHDHGPLSRWHLFASPHCSASDFPCGQRQVQIRGSNKHSQASQGFCTFHPSAESFLPYFPPGPFQPMTAHEDVYKISLYHLRGWCILFMTPDLRELGYRKERWSDKLLSSEECSSHRISLGFSVIGNVAVG